MSDVDTLQTDTDPEAVDADAAAADSEAASPGEPFAKRWGPWIAVAVLLVAGLVGAIVAGMSSGDGFSPTGITISGTATSQRTVDAQLASFADSPYFADIWTSSGSGRPFTRSDGSIDSIATAQWLAYLTQAEVADQLLAEAGAPLTTSTIDEVGKQLAQQGITEGMSDEAATVLARYQAGILGLVEQLGSEDAAVTAMRRGARRAHVSVDPRYGAVTDDGLTVCVPLGCEAGAVALWPSNRGTSSESSAETTG